jgi:phosphate transport system substrate-binding protein
MLFSMFWEPLCWLVVLVLPLVIPIIWLRKRKPYLIGYASFTLALFIAIGANFGIMKYDELITIDTAPNINVNEYLPFKKDSKIVKLDNASLKLTENLPRIDGAAAVFPVYSAFVHAVYPNDTELNDGVFEYNNTYFGYQLLARRETDIFFGAYPSKNQIDYAEENGTTFKYVPIGSEAFVFFVHKNNPIDSLTAEQIKDIYSGKITNWKEVGGRDEEIVAFQRNEGSGSQSMLKRFMGDTPIMEPPKDQINDWMSGIIEEVADYKSRSGSIGFSFRYYVEGIIKNPDIKIVAIDGIYPSVETIKNGSYPITTPLYAVTYRNNKNPNVDALIEWILSEEGQYIIEQTGYVGVSDPS